MRIAIFEDDAAFALDAEMLIQELGYEVAGVWDFGDGARERLKATQPDLVLLDILLRGETTGLDVADIAVQLRIPVIFMTQLMHKDVFEKAKAFHPCAYLVKPFHMLTLQGAIELALLRACPPLPPDSDMPEPAPHEWRDSVSGEKLYIKYNKRIICIPVHSIFYLQAARNYCTLYLANRVYTFRATLAQMAHVLAPYGFMQVHKSYLVQAEKVIRFDPVEKLLLLPPYSVPVGSHFGKALIQLPFPVNSP